MVIAVFSDSHTDTEAMDAVIGKVRPDAVVHLGDHIVDAVLIMRRHPGLRFECVRGNCDPSSSQPSQKMVLFEGVPVLLAHGHEFHVEDGPARILDEGARAGALAVLHGHTHVPGMAVTGGVLVMNPGSIRRAAGAAASFGLLSVQGQAVTGSIHFYDFIQDRTFYEGRFVR